MRSWSECRWPIVPKSGARKRDVVNGEHIFQIAFIVVQTYSICTCGHTRIKKTKNKDLHVFFFSRHSECNLFAWLKKLLPARSLNPHNVSTSHKEHSQTNNPTSYDHVGRHESIFHYPNGWSRHSRQHCHKAADQAFFFCICPKTFVYFLWCCCYFSFDIYSQRCWIPHEALALSKTAL